MDSDTTLTLPSQTRAFVSKIHACGDFAKSAIDFRRDENRYYNPVHEDAGDKDLTSFYSRWTF